MARKRSVSLLIPTICLAWLVASGDCHSFWKRMLFGVAPQHKYNNNNKDHDQCQGMIDSSPSRHGKAIVRGGGGRGDSSHNQINHKKQQQQQQNPTIQEYVAAVEERDARDRQNETNERDDDDEEEEEDWGFSPSSDPGAAEHTDSTNDDDDDNNKNNGSSNNNEDPAAVGVKSHHSQKKSGSVGDADSDDDDDSESDTDESEWEEFFEDDESLMDHQHLMEEGTPPAQVEVEVEFVEDNEDAAADSDEKGKSSIGGGGGVGVILNPRRRANNRARSVATTAATNVAQSSPVKEEEMMEAWLPHVFLPPNKAAMDYLSQNARMMDGASKSRLDRRTLYACLLLEWSFLQGNASSRKFLEKSTSQALQAALSLATQPQWRKCSSQRLCGIRLYDDAEAMTSSSEYKACTLAMQETIIMALVRAFFGGILNKQQYCVLVGGGYLVV